MLRSLCLLANLVIEIDEEQDWEDTNEDEPGPVGVVDDVVRVLAQLRRSYVDVVVDDLARIGDVRQRVDSGEIRLIRCVRRKLNPERVSVHLFDNPSRESTKHK